MKTPVAVDAEIVAVVEDRQESAPPQKASLEHDGTHKKPKITKKLEDVEIVVGSAAKFDVSVEGESLYVSYFHLYKRLNLTIITYWWLFVN